MASPGHWPLFPPNVALERVQTAMQTIEIDNQQAFTVVVCLKFTIKYGVTCSVWLRR